MLENLQKHNKRILITVDEAVNNEYVRPFINAFQIFARQEFPVFLLMTGLYENVEELQNEKNLTFLYRAPKIHMPPLNLTAITNRYHALFSISREEAVEMARLTNGYPFAFQALGFLAWKENGNYKKAVPEYEIYLAEYVYEKIWSELSAKDKTVAHAIASTKSSKIKDIRETIGMDTNAFNPYRNRLIKKGIIDGSEYGHIVFQLPLFKEFVLANHALE